MYTSCVMRLIARSTVLLVAGVLTAGVSAKQPVAPAPERPFGTLREQAAMQQDWLRKRLDTFLPALMRKHGIDLWVVPMREYNEDPVFSAITAPETFAARRRTIYVFFDKCAAAGDAPVRCVRRADCARRHVAGRRVRGAALDQGRGGNIGRGQQAELWGDEQWQALKDRHRGAQPAGHRHQSLDRLRVLRRPVERRAAGHERGARRQVDGAVPRRRGAAAGAHRRRAFPKRKRSSSGCRSWSGR